MKTPTSAIIFLASILASCGDPNQQTDKFVGHWESHSFTMDINQKDKAYLVELDNPIGMLSGSYVGELTPNGCGFTMPRPRSSCDLTGSRAWRLTSSTMSGGR